MMSSGSREATGNALQIDGSSVGSDRVLGTGAGMLGGSYAGGAISSNEGSVGSIGGPAQGVSGTALQSSPYLSHSHPTSAAAVIPTVHSSLASLGLTGMPAASNPVAAQDPRRPYDSQTSMYHSLGSTSASPAVSASSTTPTDAIWVGGLPRDVTVEKLAKYFGEFGQLKMDRTKDPPAPLIQLIRDPHTGHPRGEAKIMWDNPDHAPLAVNYFNGKHWPGVGPIRVELSAAQPLPPRQQHQQHPQMAMAHQHLPQHGDPNLAYASSVSASGYAISPTYSQQPYDPRVLSQYPSHQASLQAMSAGNVVPSAFPPQAFDPRQPSGYLPQQDAYAYAPAGPGYQSYPPSYTGAGQPGLSNIPPSSSSLPMSQQQMYYPQAPYGYAPGQMAMQPMYSSMPPEDPNLSAAVAYAAQVPPLQHNVPTGMPRVFKGKGGAARAGDWICPSCGNNNFSWRSTCKQCTVPRPPNAAVINQDEDGESGPGASGDAGAFGGPGGRRDEGGPGGPPRRRAREHHQDDWVCPRCNFKNFSKREFCHDCSAPKPLFAAHGPVRGAGQFEMRRERMNRPY